eukprot:TRINITY_DN3591_c0_g1_i2.p1 TRINITY_DN3591_c0_g1~~TRINITY_DN3591_c0_g1_i2.p1  ORF type:complete len:198 (+),score=75.18 TRINITY_DN3591_c0_g1_i2:52-645(+)
MAAIARLGRLTTSSTAFFCCDVQERFRPLIKFYPAVINVAVNMLAASEILEVPYVVTEQASRVFGHTVEEIDVKKASMVEEKTQFSMVSEAVAAHLVAQERTSVVLFGIEAHVCVLQTALDLRSRGIDVHVLTDGTSSQNTPDRLTAFRRMEQSGVFLSTSESVLFQLLRDAKHPKFRDMSSIFKKERVETGLESGF